MCALMGCGTDDTLASASGSGDRLNARYAKTTIHPNRKTSRVDNNNVVGVIATGTSSFTLLSYEARYDYHFVINNKSNVTVFLPYAVARFFSAIQARFLPISVSVYGKQVRMKDIPRPVERPTRLFCVPGSRAIPFLLAEQFAVYAPKEMTTYK